MNDTFGDEMRLYTIVQAAELLALSRATVYKLIASGDLPTVTIGTARRITSTALVQYIQLLEANAGAYAPVKPSPQRRQP